MDPTWHGSNREAAIADAEARGYVVIWSVRPISEGPVCEGDVDGYGYWTDKPGAPLRRFERLVWAQRMEAAA